VAGAVAVSLGVAMGAPTGPGVLLCALVGVALVFGIAFVHPDAGFCGLIVSSMLLVVVVVWPPKGFNGIDLLVPPVLLSTLVQVWLRGRVPAETRTAAAGAEAIVVQRRRMSRSVLGLGAIAVASLVVPAVTNGAASITDSVLAIVRSVEAALLFPLLLWWLDSEERLDLAVRALLFSALALLVLNAACISFAHVARAGMTWYLNSPGWPIDGPNEAGTALLMPFIALLALQGIRRSGWRLAFMGALIVLMVLTQSRSGLTAWLVFGAFMLPRVGKRTLVVSIVAVLLLVLLAPDYWRGRMVRSLLLQHGSSESYSILVRFYIWKAALAAFLSHPILGVGYFRFIGVSDQYNDLRITMAGAHNYFLETAAGMGIVGLAGLGLVVARLYQLGAAVRRAATPGSLGHRLAAYHGPLITALLAANLTGTNLTGMVGIAQVAVWCALLSRAGELSAPQPKPA
jgi:O-antigen ligase